MEVLREQRDGDDDELDEYFDILFADEDRDVQDAGMVGMSG